MSGELMHIFQKAFVIVNSNYSWTDLNLLKLNIHAQQILHTQALTSVPDSGRTRRSPSL